MTDDVGRQVADRMMELCGDMIAEAEARGRKQAANQIAERIVQYLARHPRAALCEGWDIACAFAAEQDTGP